MECVPAEQIHTKYIVFFILYEMSTPSFLVYQMQ